MTNSLKWMYRVRARMSAIASLLVHSAWPGNPDDKISPDTARSGHQSLGDTEFKGLTKSAQSIADLIRIYRASRSYVGLSAATKSSYSLYLKRIEQKFGELPIGVLDERGARRVLRQWRDDVLAARPRTADATMGVFRVLLNFAVNEEYIDKNPAARLGNIHTNTRRDVIWTDEQIETFWRKAPRHLARALLLALWTGQRQTDLLTLQWSSYDGKYIRLQQSKTGRGTAGRRVKILVSNELRRVLAEIAAEQIGRANNEDVSKQVPRPATILTTSKGMPWRLGFRATWRKAVADAGISGVTFHDLRGTFITLSHRSGSTIREIAEASGHDEKSCEQVIRQHYLASGAEGVITKLESSKHFVAEDWMARGETNIKSFHDAGRFTGPRKPRVCNANLRSLK